MNTIKDFENAPVGATATTADGVRAMKMLSGGEPRWIARGGSHLDVEGMERWGYTLDSPAPTTAREALDLAWDLAHEVKEGQHILEGTRYLELLNSVVKEYTAQNDVKINSGLVQFVRTLEPLPEPEPEPDWLDAPAVIAVCNDTMDRDVFVRRGDNSWRSEFYGAGTHDLRDVVPLYPLAEGTLNGTTAPDD